MHEECKIFMLSGVLSKDYINKQVYNKFLKIKNDVIDTIDSAKIEVEQQWEEVIEADKTITTIRINMPVINSMRIQALFLTEKQHQIKSQLDLASNLGEK